ncbi:hypothetical protein ACHAAC_07525 [Aeromicrobium sp. CF4.19]|uniref:hypothetical protein n=1 Tax=Aeromicrobium sp. CF4.19 TaxID=3373082 RepID=UPI003EE4C663
MDDTIFDIEQGQLAEGCRRFPAHRRDVRHARPAADLSYLHEGGDFGRHAWDEGGRP